MGFKHIGNPDKDLLGVPILLMGFKHVGIQDLQNYKDLLGVPILLMGFKQGIQIKVC